MRGEIEQNRERRHEAMEIEIVVQKDIIDTYSSDAKEWPEAPMAYAKLKGELETQIRVIIGFGELGEKIDKWGEVRKPMASLKELMQMGVGRKQALILEEGEWGKAIGDFDI